MPERPVSPKARKKAVASGFDGRMAALGLVLPDVGQAQGRLPSIPEGAIFNFGVIVPGGIHQEPHKSLEGAADSFRFAQYAVDAVQTGRLIYLSGKGPADPFGKPLIGQAGNDLSVEEAYEHARNVALTHLSVLKRELGSLERVKRVVKVIGMVNAAPCFTQHSEVINGWSDVFVNVFGEQGRHARSAVGMSSLPRGISVEVEAIVEIHGARRREK